MVSENNSETIGQAVSFSSAASGLSFIEQLQISSLKPCTKENQIRLIGVNENERKALLTKAACKCWDCETCGARNAKRWVATIINGINSLEMELSFLTITAHPKHRGLKSVENLRKGWKKLYNRILSKAGLHKNALYFCRIWEQHENGAFHLHVLINICFGTRWAKDNAAECGLGYMADWHTVENAGQVAGYMAKYTLKNSTIARGGVKWPKGLRRIETSRNWPKLPSIANNSEYVWNLAQNAQFQAYKADILTTAGYQVVDLTGDSVI